MTKINFEMTRLRLQKSFFLHNPNYQEPKMGEMIALGLSLRNGAEFSQNNTIALFLQSFKTQAGPEVPFSLEVDFSAVFSLTTPITPADYENLTHQIFPQMVFPYTREYVAEITRRGGYPPLILKLGLFQDNQNSGSGATVESLSSTKWIH
ncbi:MAG: protein-export chaperone SecB [Deltaproteobacteria bacterium]|jgi:preprotein translocase subunit SecB|nr:protein-export chaperone SecB [Deltaproteobacteria bacterium]